MDERYACWENGHFDCAITENGRCTGGDLFEEDEDRSYTGRAADLAWGTEDDTDSLEDTLYDHADPANY